MTDQPKQPPAPPDSPSNEGGEHTDHGIPNDAHEEEATGLPNSDRQNTETAPTKP